MSKTLNIRPADGVRQLKCPDSGVVVDAKGGKVPNTAWWRSRIRTGRAIDVDAERAAAAAQAKAEVEAKKGKGKDDGKGKGGAGDGKSGE